MITYRTTPVRHSARLPERKRRIHQRCQKQFHPLVYTYIPPVLLALATWNSYQCLYYEIKLWKLSKIHGYEKFHWKVIDFDKQFWWSSLFICSYFLVISNFLLNPSHVTFILYDCNIIQEQGYIKFHIFLFILSVGEECQVWKLER